MHVGNPQLDYDGYDILYSSRGTNVWAEMKSHANLMSQAYPIKSVGPTHTNQL
jgi:hypothetical protein